MSKTTRNAVQVRAPGRLCLLGEHQDYLGLEVISGAMNLGIRMIAEPLEPEMKLVVDLEQIGRRRILALSGPGSLEPRDYLQSGLNEMMELGYLFDEGWHVRVNGDLPIGKGVSSSSALCVAWIKLLAAISTAHEDMPPLQVARHAHQIEVKRFREPGGMQDHIASALGGLIHMNFNGNPDTMPALTPMEPVPDGFLLVDSGQSKETIGMISRIRNCVEQQFSAVGAGRPALLSDLSVQDMPEFPGADDPFKELRATLRNRDLTHSALKAWPTHAEDFPEFLTAPIRKHHALLANGIGSSSSAIDECINWCIRNGARAGKVIGSGGGGCLLIYAPEHPAELAEKLQRKGYRGWSVFFGQGVCIL